MPTMLVEIADSRCPPASGVLLAAGFTSTSASGRREPRQARLSRSFQLLLVGLGSWSRPPTIASLLVFPCGPVRKPCRLESASLGPRCKSRESWFFGASRRAIEVSALTVVVPEPAVKGGGALVAVAVDRTIGPS